MGTKGCVVFRYRGIYYIFYNRSDSYFSHLGNLVLKEIKDILLYDQLNVLKNLLSKVPVKENASDKEATFHGIIENIQNYDCFCYFTSSVEQTCSLFIEYVYTIDLDNKKFIVQEGDRRASFTFNDMPDYLTVSIFEEEEDEEDEEDEEEEEEEEEEENNEIIEVLDSDNADIIKLKMKILESQIKLDKLTILLKQRTADEEDDDEDEDEEEDEENNEIIEVLDSDSAEIITLKMKILESQIKLDKLAILLKQRNASD
jgi:hypothetical protein